MVVTGRLPWFDNYDKEKKDFDPVVNILAISEKNEDAIYDLHDLHSKTHIKGTGSKTHYPEKFEGDIYTLAGISEFCLQNKADLCLCNFEYFADDANCAAKICDHTNLFIVDCNIYHEISDAIEDKLNKRDWLQDTPNIENIDADGKKTTREGTDGKMLGPALVFSYVSEYRVPESMIMFTAYLEPLNNFLSRKETTDAEAIKERHLFQRQVARYDKGKMGREYLALDMKLFIETARKKIFELKNPIRSMQKHWYGLHEDRNSCIRGECLSTSIQDGVKMLQDFYLERKYVDIITHDSTRCKYWFGCRGHESYYQARDIIEKIVELCKGQTCETFRTHADMKDPVFAKNLYLYNRREIEVDVVEKVFSIGFLTVEVHKEQNIQGLKLPKPAKGSDYCGIGLLLIILDYFLGADIDERRLRYRVEGGLTKQESFFRDNKIHLYVTDEEVRIVRHATKTTDIKELFECYYEKNGKRAGVECSFIKGVLADAKKIGVSDKLDALFDEEEGMLGFVWTHCKSAAGE